MQKNNRDDVHLGRLLTIRRHLASGQSYVSPMRIRQVAWVVKNLEESVEELCKCLDLKVTFRDPEIHELGVTNCVCVLGDQFLEMVSPMYEKDNTAAKQLQRRKGDGGYMFMLQAENFDKEQARLATRGFSEVLHIDRPGQVKESHLHPKDTGKCIVSISQMFPTSSQWIWGGPDWKDQSEASTKVAKGIRGVIIQSENVSQVVEKYKMLLNCQPRKLSDCSEFVLDNGRQFIRIIPAFDGRGDGLNGVVMESTHQNTVGKEVDVRGLRVIFT